jgi:hypothetical protein
LLVKFESATVEGERNLARIGEVDAVPVIPGVVAELHQLPGEFGRLGLAVKGASWKALAQGFAIGYSNEPGFLWFGLV